MAGREDKGTTKQRKLERQLRMGTMTSRRSLMERDKAMEAARNPGVSRFGDCLVTINSKTDRMLTTSLRKINAEIRQMEMQINQKKKHFVKKSGVLNHDPLILVERPASPEVRKRAMVLRSGSDLGGDPSLSTDAKLPGYMKPLRSRTRTPSTLTTIDAFTLKTRKKRNIWEEAMDDKSTPVFHSTVRPVAKLTRREENDLQIGYSYHKPRLTPDTGISSDTEDNHKSASPWKRKQVRGQSSAIWDGDSSDSDFDDITPFITQMAKVKKAKSSARTNEDSLISEIRIRSPKTVNVRQSPGHEHERVKDLKAARSVRFASPVAPTPTGTLSSVAPIPTGTLQSVAPIPTGTLSSVAPIPTGTLQSVAPTPTGTLSSVAPIPTGTLQSVAPIPTGTQSSVAPNPTGTLSSVAPIPTGTLSSVAPNPTGTLSSVAPIPTGTLSSVAPNPTGTLSSVAPIPTGTLSSVAPNPTGTLSSVAPTPTGTLSSVAPTPTGTLSSVAPIPTGTLQSVAPNPTGRQLATDRRQLATQATRVAY